MELRQLEMFRAVAETGSFTAAATKLHISQSAISRQVKLLEDELGSQLLHRGARGVSLTPSGELMLSLGHRLNRDVENVVARIAEAQELVRGSLTVGGGMTVCMHVLPPVLRKYRRSYAGVDLKVVTGRNEALLALLRGHEVDLCLLTLPIVDKDLAVVPVIKEEMVVVTAPNHPLANKRSVDVDTLASFPQILYELGSNTRRVQDRLFALTDRSLNVAMETENVEITKAMVRAGLGVSLIPYTAGAREVRSGRLAITRVRGQRLFREAGWVYLASEYVPPPVGAMLELFDELELKNRLPDARRAPGSRA